MDSNDEVIAIWNLDEKTSALGVPRCSWDNRHVAFSFFIDGGKRPLHVAESHGSNVVPVSNARIAGNVSRERDSGVFYYMAIEDPPLKIYQVSGFPRSISTFHIASDAKYPAISSNGRLLIFVCYYTDDLCIIDFSETSIQTLVDLSYSSIDGVKIPATAM